VRRLSYLVFDIAEEEPGKHQQPFGAGDEVRKVHSGVQDLLEDPAVWQG
jgi:hypothetical protein